MNIKSIVYVGRNLFITKWHEECEFHNYKYKVSKLKLGQIEGLLYFIYLARKYNLYKLADYIRNKLVMIGNYWFADKHKGFLNMHHNNHLLFMSGKRQANRDDIFRDNEMNEDGVNKNFVSIRGSIISNKEKFGKTTDFYYEFK